MSCKNGSDGLIKVSAEGGSGAYKYSRNGGIFVSSGTFPGLQAGTYSITVKDGNSCIKSVTIVIKNGTGQCGGNLARRGEEVSATKSREANLLKAAVFPYPGESEFTLKVTGSSNESVAINVIDIYGRSVQKARGLANQSYKFGHT